MVEFHLDHTRNPSIHGCRSTSVVFSKYRSPHSTGNVRGTRELRGRIGTLTGLLISNRSGPRSANDAARGYAMNRKRSWNILQRTVCASARFPPPTHHETIGQSIVAPPSGPTLNHQRKKRALRKQAALLGRLLQFTDPQC